MNEIAQLPQQLLAEESPLCLDLLEAALAGRNYWKSGATPKELLLDMERALGEDAVRAETTRLLELGLLERIEEEEGQAVRLSEHTHTAVEALLWQRRCHKTLPTRAGSMEAWQFLQQLLSYLPSVDSAVSILAQAQGSCLLACAGESYRLQLSLSPFWVPLALEKSEEEESFLIAIGPFAARGWEAMHPYFDIEAFRRRIALYDPWAKEKMCLCRGALPVYIDWFFRDKYKSRFSIPENFCNALHEIGMLRYNDER